MTNTPETDANQIFLGLNPDEGDYFVPAEIARKLEQQRDWYKAACDKYSEVETINTLCSLKEQRDRLAEAIRKHRDELELTSGDSVDRILWNTLEVVKGGSHE
jgi:hypothetical protein